ncbi:MAG TPA: hypothetical protein VGF80_04235 [Galbitalea sp.]|jgi:hypothetical protein
MISAALLPANVRERYREQWLGELRDAPELGIRTSEIAFGSLAFASTFARMTPARRHPSPETVDRRARMSVALTASAAVLAFSQNASAPWSAQTGTDGITAAIGLLWTAITIYVVIAPFAAMVTVFATRGTNGWLRAAVVLLATVCALPISPYINRISMGPNELAYLTLATIALPALGVVVAMIALTVRHRSVRPNADMSSPRIAARLARALLAALVVAAIVGAGFAAASRLWDTRIPLRYGGHKPSAEFDQWFAVKTQVEHSVSVTLALWLVIGIVVAFAVALMASSRRGTLRQTITLLVVASSAVVFSFGSLLSFLQFVLTSIAPSFPLGLGTELAEIGLVIVLLVVASGKRETVSSIPGPAAGLRSNGTRAA